MSDDMPSTLQGVWAFSDARDTTSEIFLKIFSDGRIAQFYKRHTSHERRVAMTMRASAEGRDVFRIKTTAEAEGYLVEIRRETASLVVVNKRLRTVCRPIAATELPEWFEESCERAVWR